MNHEINQYIDKNREQLDTEMPDPQVWEQVRTELHPREKRSPIWYVAASAVVLIGLSAAGYLYFDEPLESHAGMLAEDFSKKIEEIPITFEEEAEMVLPSPSEGEPTEEGQFREEPPYTPVQLAEKEGPVATDEPTEEEPLATEVVVLADANGSEAVVKKIFPNKDFKATTHFSLAATSDGSFNRQQVSGGTGTYGWTIQGTLNNQNDGTGLGFYRVQTPHHGTVSIPASVNDRRNYQKSQSINFGDGDLGYAYDQSHWGEFEDRDGNPITTAVPFLHIDPQSRSENYERLPENGFLQAAREPLSTFSIDVDGASYSNTRRFLNNDQLPPPSAVRLEELVNYFPYNYKTPKATAKHPFAVNTELGTCPWNKAHHLVMVGLKGMEVDLTDAPANNLVFLLDVSGSMNEPNKLGFLKKGFRMLVQELREEDRVAIVVYAGAAGVVLPSTSGANKTKILNALEALEAGGSTAGGEGLDLAYKLASESFLENGNNRIILATDGDFNVGVSQDAALVEMIEQKLRSGVFLSVLGLGEGNLQDSKMERIANHGNGNYSYIDNLLEAKKVFVSEMGGTLITIAKDVKLQVEFNPTKVRSYRLLGYENRQLENRDFADDTKDAGELGAGHTVTAIYEIVPVGAESKADDASEEDALKYQQPAQQPTEAFSDEWMTVKFRYKEPDGETSKLLSTVVEGEVRSETSNSFRFAAAVAEFGLLLGDSKYKADASWEQVLSHARNARGEDPNGYRAEFIRLVEKAILLTQDQAGE